MSARKSSHCTIFLIVSSGSPLALIASSLRSISKKPFCPIMTRSLHPPMTACAHRVRFAGTWREEFFEAPTFRFLQMCVHRTPRIVPMTAYAPPSLLHQVWEYPLFEALYGRRSRRFGLGLAMAEGPFKYRFQGATLPLSDVEEALLVAAGGFRPW